MSFILDALKKSESERQQHQSAEFSSVPSGRDTAPVPRWLWVLGALLLVNVVVVGTLLLRSDDPSAAIAIADRDRLAPAAVANARTGDALPDNGTSGEPAPSFSDRVAAARRDQAAESQERPAAATPATRRGAATAARPALGIAELPSLVELQLDGSVNLPPLHIDLHVYTDDPERRFVSINMNKYRENERLREGPLVRQITREGVVLEYDGHTFAVLQ